MSKPIGHSPRRTKRGTLEVVLSDLTDGVVSLRAPNDADRERLLDGRDEEWRRWLGPGTGDPQPTACIVVNLEVVGWIDFDTDRDWLQPEEVNIGYNVFAPHRGHGYASRAVRLMLVHLDESTPYRTATLLIHPDNAASLAVAAITGFAPSGEINGRRYFKRPATGA